MKLNCYWTRYLWHENASRIQVFNDFPYHRIKKVFCITTKPISSYYLNIEISFGIMQCKLLEIQMHVYLCLSSCLSYTLKQTWNLNRSIFKSLNARGIAWEGNVEALNWLLHEGQLTLIIQSCTEKSVQFAVPFYLSMSVKYSAMKLQKTFKISQTLSWGQ